MKDCTEQALLQQARADEACMSELLQRYQPLLRRTVASFAPMPYEDCMQEAGLAFVEAVRHYDDTRGVRFATYAYVCMRNRLLRYKKQQAAEAEQLSADMISVRPTPEDVLVTQELLAEQKIHAKRVLSALEYAVWRMRLDGYSYAEIAVALSDEGKSLTIKNVNNALQRARRKLRKIV